MFTVYVLRSLKNKRLYIGHTNNLERRLAEHNLGKSKYTRLTRPFELIITEIFSTRSEAAKRERNLKSGQGRQWIKQLAKAVA